MDVICNGGHISYLVNGAQANEAFDVRPSSGKILLQAEGAEVFVRRFELLPLKSVARTKAKSTTSKSGAFVILQNDQLGLAFDRKTGTLKAVKNKLAGETYKVKSDRFDIDAVEFQVLFADAKLVGLSRGENTLTANYRSDKLNIQARYTLRGHFVEKVLTLSDGPKYGI